MKFKIASAAVMAMIGFFGLTGPAGAGPITFAITSGGYTPGSGYGSANGQLDVTFTPLITSTTSFSLSAVNQNQVLNFGTVRLNNEKCISESTESGAGCSGGSNTDGETLNERDNLDVTALLNFTNPLSGQVTSIAVVGTFVGPTGDAASDFTINFDPVEVSFGSGGKFTVDFHDLVFTDRNQSFTETVTITLTALPIDRPQTTDVPEPASLAILGMGLAGLGAIRRRRRA